MATSHPDYASLDGSPSPSQHLPPGRFATGQVAFFYATKHTALPTNGTNTHSVESQEAILSHFTEKQRESLALQRGEEVSAEKMSTLAEEPTQHPATTQPRIYTARGGGLCSQHEQCRR